MNCGLYDRLIYSNLDKIYCRKESTATFHGRCRRQEVRFIDLHLFHSRIIQLISCIMLPLNEKPHNTFYHFLTTLSRYFFNYLFRKYTPFIMCLYFLERWFKKSLIMCLYFSWAWLHENPRNFKNNVRKNTFYFVSKN